MAPAAPPMSLADIGAAWREGLRCARGCQLAVSRALNPDCEHVTDDMRTMRLGRIFELVFVHDAVSYLTTEDDLRAALETSAPPLP